MEHKYHFIKDVQSYEEDNKSEWRIGFIPASNLKELTYSEEEDCYKDLFPTANILNLGAYPMCYPTSHPDSTALYALEFGLVRYRHVTTVYNKVRKVHTELQLLDFITSYECIELQMFSLEYFHSCIDYIEDGFTTTRYLGSGVCYSSNHDYSRNYKYCSSSPMWVLEGQLNTVEFDGTETFTVANLSRSYIYSSADNHVLTGRMDNTKLVFSGDNNYYISNHGRQNSIISRGLNSCCLTTGSKTALLHTNDNSCIFDRGHLNHLVSLGNNSRIFSTEFSSHTEAHGDYSIVCNFSADGCGVAFGKGSWLILSESDSNGGHINVRAGLVGRDIEAGVYYKLVDNEFVEKQRSICVSPSLQATT